MRRFAFPLIVLLFIAGDASTQVASPAPSARVHTVDGLLDGCGRMRHADRLKHTRVGGQTYDWKTYARWGKELFYEGQVKQPPRGFESRLISVHKDYTCNRCHNDCREDPVLASPEAAARFDWLTREKKTNVALVQGSTMWGAVNRVEFYNGVYARYRDLEIPDFIGRMRTMDPKSLPDAIQVCSRYCSVGQRFLEPWELDALVTYLWELEVTLDDVDLNSSERDALVRVLADPTASTEAAVAQQRKLLRSRILLKSPATELQLPSEDADLCNLQGNVAVGKTLYDLSCLRCHHNPGQDERIGGPGGSELLMDTGWYYEMIAHGTEQAGTPYMPQYTAERLSLQQAADIKAYLESLSK